MTTAIDPREENTRESADVPGTAPPTVTPATETTAGGMAPATLSTVGEMIPAIVIQPGEGVKILLTRGATPGGIVRQPELGTPASHPR